ncbi:MAG: DNA/RNA non-specific endonuclease [Myxococcaceae bacterium]
MSSVSTRAPEVTLRTRSSPNGEKSVSIRALAKWQGWGPLGWAVSLLRRADAAAHGRNTGFISSEELAAYLQAPVDGAFVTSDALATLIAATGEGKDLTQFESEWQRNLAARATAEKTPARLTPGELQNYVGQLLSDGFDTTPVIGNSVAWVPNQKAAMLQSAVAEATGDAFDLNPGGEASGATTLLKDYMRVRAFDEYRVPQYVSYELSSDDLALVAAAEAGGRAPALERHGNFRADQTSEFSARPSDYLRSGFAQGHLRPARDSANAESMRESFVQTNMSPQRGGLNSEAWLLLEEATRQVVGANLGDATIFTGNLFLNRNGNPTDPRHYIGENRVAVPTHLWKAVLLTDKDGNKHAYAYLVPNKDPGTRNRDEMAEFLKKARVSIDDLETLTGLDLYTSLPDDVETTLESAASALMPVPAGPNTHAALRLWPQ